MPKAVVLLYGLDTQLLDTRRLILEREGIHVHSVASLKAIGPVAETEPVDLLILCHTLSREQSTKAIQTVSAAHPRVKILMLVTTFSAAQTEDLKDVDQTFADPDTLVTNVRAVLAGTSVKA